MDELKKAIEAAGHELIGDYGWTLDDDESKPVLRTLFGQVLLKHLSPLVSIEGQRAAKVARIAALRAELLALESPQ